MSSGLLSIGTSALTASYAALRTTGNNIANVNTPGYSRQLVSFSALAETDLGGNYFGNGVAVDTVKRAYNDLLVQQTNLAQAQSSAADQRVQLLNQVDNLFSNTTTGLGAAVDKFFTQVQALTQQPGDAATRQTMLSTAQQMAGQFNDVANQLQLMQNGADQQLAQQIAHVNQTVKQIAGLNDKIALATASGGNPNDLLDQRDLAIQTLNKAIGVTAMAQSDGAVNLFLADGQPLVVGDHMSTMAMVNDPNNPQGVEVGIANGPGSVIALNPANNGGGQIGALLQFRSQDLPSVQNQIGRLAVTLSSQFNAQHAYGQDQNGATGTAFFSAPSISVTAAAANPDKTTVTLAGSYTDTTQLQASDYKLQVVGGQYQLTRLSDGHQFAASGSLPLTADGISLNFSGGTPANGDVFLIQPVRSGANNLSVAITQTSQIAAASPLQASTSSSNQGSLTVGNLSLQALSPSPPAENPNLLAAVQLNFTSPTSYTYTTGGATSSAQAYTPGKPILINGWSLALTGTPANGDVVNVSASGSGSGDNRNALQLAQLQGLQLLNGVSLGSAFSGVVAQVGSITSAAQIDQQAKQSILQDATNAQSSVSGVNLDEEASRLLQYQQQYQAAAKLIATASTLFNTLLQVAGAA